MRKPRVRITYANVVATLALFVTLGGVSYAAVKLPKNSVGPAQIKKNAVSGVKVRNGSLTLADFKASQRAKLRGPQGASGPQGAQGPQGSPGVSGLEIVEASTAFDSEDSKEEEVSCPPGKRVFGGGAAVEGAFTFVAIDFNGPDGDSTWRGAAHEHDATANPWEVVVFAICGNAS